MKIYREIELDDEVFLSDAAQWIAFGRLPDEREMEDRFESQSHGYDRPSWTPELHLSEAEFGAFLPGEDYGAHQAVRDDALGHLWLGAVPPEQSEPTAWMNMLRKQREEARTRLEQLLAPVRQRLDRAFMEMAPLLMDGRLIARGRFVPLDENVGDVWSRAGDLDVEHQDIPATDWELRASDFTRSALWLKRGCFIDIELDTSKLLHAFPRPMGASRTISVTFFPGTLIADADDPTISTRPRRRSVEIAEAVQNEFSRRYAQGIISQTAKRQSVESDAQNYILKELGAKRSRASVQRYLKTVFERYAAPETD